MDTRTLFGLWLFSSLVASALIFVVRMRWSPRQGLSFNQAIAIALGVGSCLSGIQVILQTLKKFDQLEKLVGLEGCVFAALGGIASFWFGASEIGKLLTHPSASGTSGNP